jgi:hypothetical protein
MAVLYCSFEQNDKSFHYASSLYPVFKPLDSVHLYDSPTHLALVNHHRTHSGPQFLAFRLRDTATSIQTTFLTDNAVLLNVLITCPRSNSNNNDPFKGPSRRIISVSVDAALLSTLRVVRMSLIAEPSSSRVRAILRFRRRLRQDSLNWADVFRNEEWHFSIVEHP